MAAVRGFREPNGAEPRHCQRRRSGQRAPLPQLGSQALIFSRLLAKVAVIRKVMAVRAIIIGLKAEGYATKGCWLPVNVKKDGDTANRGGY
jgi:hypothetical protein